MGFCYIQRECCTQCDTFLSHSRFTVIKFSHIHLFTLVIGHAIFIYARLETMWAFSFLNGSTDSQCFWIRIPNVVGKVVEHILSIQHLQSQSANMQNGLKKAATIWDNGKKYDISTSLIVVTVALWVVADNKIFQTIFKKSWSSRTWAFRPFSAWFIRKTNFCWKKS